MSQKQTCTWVGASGKKYVFTVHDLDFVFNPDQDGNYIYTRLNEQNLWIPIYIGEGDLKDRRENHHKADCVSKKGATHFHAHLNANEKTRKAEETDLLANYSNAYKPTGCNEKIGG